jgi:hypothetical protein
MEKFDISGIDEVITDWYFTNNELVDMLGLEFIEVTKNEEDCSFCFIFNRNHKKWQLKYENEWYSFESESDEDDHISYLCGCE